MPAISRVPDRFSQLAGSPRRSASGFPGIDLPHAKAAAITMLKPDQRFCTTNTCVRQPASGDSLTIIGVCRTCINKPVQRQDALLAARRDNFNGIPVSYAFSSRYIFIKIRYLRYLRHHSWARVTGVPPLPGLQPQCGVPDRYIFIAITGYKSSLAVVSHHACTLHGRLSSRCHHQSGDPQVPRSR